jgi:CBS-domain-containing membrane protein
MKISELMTTDVQSCHCGALANRAAQLMWEHDVGCVPVVDANGRVVGIVTDRDLCMAAYTQGRPLEEILVGSAMSRVVHSVHPDDHVESAAQRMSEQRVRRLPVLDDQSRLVGLLSLNDLAMRGYRRATRGHRLESEIVADTLAAVCEPRMSESGAACPVAPCTAPDVSLSAAST